MGSGTNDLTTPSKIKQMSLRTAGVRRSFDELISEKHFLKSSKEILEFVESTLNDVSNLDNVPEKEEECELPVDAHYVIKRLVSGLCSDKQQTRHGCYTTLETLLQLHPSIFKCALALIRKVFENNNNEINRDYYFGQALAYGALLRSGCVDENDDDFLSNVIYKLVQLSKRKGFMEVVGGQFIVNLLLLSNTNKAAAIIWDNLGAELCGSISELTPSQLWIRIIITRPIFIQKLAIPKSLPEETYSSKSYEVIHSAIWRLCLLEVNVTPILEDLFQSLMLFKGSKEGADNIAEFFANHVVKLLKKGTPKKSIYALNCTQMVLSHLDTSDQVAVVLCPAVVQEIINGCQLKSDETVAASARGLCAAILQMIKSNKDNTDIQVAVIKQLVSHPGSVRFDKITHTKLLQLSNESFGAEAIKGIVSILKENIKTDKYECSKGLQGQKIFSGDLVSSAQWLACLVHLPPVSSSSYAEWRAKCATFLLRHTYFREHPPKEKGLLRQSYQKCLKIPTKKLSDHVSFIELVVLKVDELMNSKKSGKCGLSVDGIELRKEISLKMGKIRDGKHADEMDSLLFRLLYGQLSLHLFTDSTSAKELLTDLDECYKKAKKHRKSMKLGDAKKNGEEAEWVGVVVDLLLSLLSKWDQFGRNVVISSFKMLCHIMLPTSLTLLSDIIDPDKEEAVLKNEDVDSEEEMDVEEDGLQSDGESDSDGDEESMEDEEDEEESEEEADSTEEEENDDEKDPSMEEKLLELKMKMQKVAGPGLEDEPDMDDMSDTEMNNLDRSLGALFLEYNRVRGKNKLDRKKKKLTIEKTSLMHFRTRVCDLFDGLITEAPSPAHLIALICPLLRALKWSSKNDLQKQLHNRLIALISSLSKTKKFATMGSITPSDIAKSINDLYIVGRKMPVTSSNEVGKCCSFLVRIGLTLLGDNSNNDDNPVSEAYARNFESYLRKTGWEVSDEAIIGPLNLPTGSLIAILRVIRTHAFVNTTTRNQPTKSHYEMLKMILVNQEAVGKMAHRDIEEVQKDLSAGIIEIFERSTTTKQIKLSPTLALLDFLKLMYIGHTKITAMRAGFDWQSIIESLKRFYESLAGSDFRGLVKEVKKLADILKVDLSPISAQKISTEATNGKTSHTPEVDSKTAKKERKLARKLKREMGKDNKEDERKQLSEDKEEEPESKRTKKEKRSSIIPEHTEEGIPETTKNMESDSTELSDAKTSKKLEKKLRKEKRKQERMAQEESEDLKPSKGKGKKNKKSKREKNERLYQQFESANKVEELKMFSFAGASGCDLED